MHSALAKTGNEVKRVWSRYRRNLKNRCRKDVVEYFGITSKINMGNGVMRDPTTAEIVARVMGLTGPELRLFCKAHKDVGSHVVCNASPLTASQGEVQEGFDEDLIWELLQYLFFEVMGEVGVSHALRFNGLYPIPAIAFVCTAVGPLSFCRNGTF